MSIHADPAEFVGVEHFRFCVEVFMVLREDCFVNYRAQRRLGTVKRAAETGLGNRGPESRGGT